MSWRVSRLPPAHLHALRRPERRADLRAGVDGLPGVPVHDRAERRHPRLGLVAHVPDQRQGPPGREDPGDLRHRERRVEPVPGMGDDHRVHAGVRRAVSARRSPRPPRRRARSPPVARASPREGSTAVTFSPASTSERVSLPVPAPRSSTRLARRGTSHSTADPGYSGRPRWYWPAAVPKDDACSRRDQRLVAPCLVIPHAAPISSQLAAGPRRSPAMISARPVSIAAIAAVRRARPSSPPPPATSRAVSCATSLRESLTESSTESLTIGNICCLTRPCQHLLLTVLRASAARRDQVGTRSSPARPGWC